MGDRNYHAGLSQGSQEGPDGCNGRFYATHALGAGQEEAPVGVWVRVRVRVTVRVRVSNGVVIGRGKGGGGGAEKSLRVGL